MESGSDNLINNRINKIRTKPYNNDIIFLCFQLRLLPFLLLLQRPASPEGKAIEDRDGIHRSLQNPTIGKASRKLPPTGNILRLIHALYQRAIIIIVKP